VVDEVARRLLLQHNNRHKASKTPRTGRTVASIIVTTGRLDTVFMGIDVEDG
jgi:hypothetical protein